MTRPFCLTGGKMSEFGAFNIKSNQFLGTDPANYMMRDDARTIVLWGEMDTNTGRFVATRNPIKYEEGETGGAILFKDDGKIEGVKVDNSVDYRGSEFYDEGFMQRDANGSLKQSDVLEFAAQMSKDAKETMYRSGEAPVHHKFFKLPE